MNNNQEQKDESKQQNRNSRETKSDTSNSTYLPNYDTANNRWRHGPRLRPNNDDEPPSPPPSPPPPNVYSVPMRRESILPSLRTDFVAAHPDLFPEHHSQQRLGVYTETDDEALRRIRRIHEENFPPMEVVEAGEAVMLPMLVRVEGMSDDDVARVVEERRIQAAAAAAAQEEEWRAEALAERLDNPADAGGHGLEPIENLYGDDSDIEEGGGRRPTKKRKNKTKKKTKMKIKKRKTKIKKRKTKTKIKKKTNKRKNGNIKKRKKRKTKRV